MRENMWIESLTSPLQGICARYADNRFLVYFLSRRHPAPTELLDKNFYGGAIVLEDEPRTIFLGCEIFTPPAGQSVAIADEIQWRYMIHGLPPGLHSPTPSASLEVPPTGCSRLHSDFLIGIQQPS